MESSTQPSSASTYLENLRVRVGLRVYWWLTLSTSTGG